MTNCCTIEILAKPYGQNIVPLHFRPNYTDQNMTRHKNFILSDSTPNSVLLTISTDTNQSLVRLEHALIGMNIDIVDHQKWYYYALGPMAPFQGNLESHMNA